jgi:hypothetical protein
MSGSFFLPKVLAISMPFISLALIADSIVYQWVYSSRFIRLSIGIYWCMVMQKIMVSMSDEMVKALDLERKARKLETIPEAVRAILGEYFKVKESH